MVKSNTLTADSFFCASFFGAMCNVYSFVPTCNMHFVRTKTENWKHLKIFSQVDAEMDAETDAETDAEMDAEMDAEIEIY